MSTSLSYEHVLSLLDNIADGVTAQDRSGSLLYANDAAARLSGYESAEAMLNAPLTDFPERFELMDEDGQPLDFSQLPGRLALQGMVNPERVLRFRHRVTGEERWSHVKARPVFGSDGQVIFVVNIFHDITRLQRVQAQLRESEARFRAMADSAPVMIWIADTSKACTYFNKPWLEFTGRAVEQELGYGWVDGVHPEDYERVMATYSSAFDARTPFTMDYRLRHHSGEHRWVLDNGVPLFAPDGTFAGYIGSCMDITERKRAEQEAQQMAAMRERQRLARDLHDAVSQILFSASVLSESLPRVYEIDPGKALPLLEKLRTLNRGAQAEMRSLLMELRPEMLRGQKLENLLAQLVDAARARKTIDFALRLNVAAQPTPEVRTAYYRITQEALNNVIKHAFAQHVIIDLTVREGYARLRVCDDGQGFHPANAEAGLGLSSMRERADEIGARLRLYTSPRRGTFLSVTWHG